MPTFQFIAPSPLPVPAEHVMFAADFVRWYTTTIEDQPGELIVQLYPKNSQRSGDLIFWQMPTQPAFQVFDAEASTSDAAMYWQVPHPSGAMLWYSSEEPTVPFHISNLPDPTPEKLAAMLGEPITPEEYDEYDRIFQDEDRGRARATMHADRETALLKRTDEEDTTPSFTNWPKDT